MGCESRAEGVDGDRQEEGSFDGRGEGLFGAQCVAEGVMQGMEGDEINYQLTEDQLVCETLSHDWPVDMACPLGSACHQ